MLILFHIFFYIPHFKPFSKELLKCWTNSSKGVFQQHMTLSSLNLIGPQTFESLYVYTYILYSHLYSTSVLQTFFLFIATSHHLIMLTFCWIMVNLIVNHSKKKVIKLKTKSQKDYWLRCKPGKGSRIHWLKPCHKRKNDEEIFLKDS